MAKTIHIVPNGNSWSVKESGNPIPLSNHRTQSMAIDIGETVARRLQTELTIHRPNGQIRDRDSYGNDPNPPRDRKH